MTISDKHMDPRTEETRRKLIDVGIHLFGLHGYDAVSTRSITRAADANLSAITYHFDGKEGFYEACLTTILDRIIENQTPMIMIVENMIHQAHGNPQALANIVGQLAHRLVQGFLASQDFDAERAFLLREHAVPTRFYSDFIDRVPATMLALMEKLVVAATDLKPGTTEAKVRAFLFMGQGLSLLVARQALKQRLGIDGYDDSTLQTISEQTALSMTASLGLPPPDSDCINLIDIPSMTQGSQNDRH